MSSTLIVCEAMTQAILSLARLRQRIEKNLAEPRAIITVHRIGYKYICCRCVVDGLQLSVQAADRL